MATKEEDIEIETVCPACLCVEPSLHEIVDEKQKRFYLDALRDAQLCDVPPAAPRVCWQCAASLRSAVAFREQLRDSYTILHTYTSESLQEWLVRDAPRAPRLAPHPAFRVDIAPLGQVQGAEEVKAEVVFVKDEEGRWGLDREDVKCEKSPSELGDGARSEFGDDRASSDQIGDDRKPSERFGEDRARSDISDEVDMLESEVKALLGDDVIGADDRDDKTRSKAKKRVGKKARKNKPPHPPRDSKIVTVELSHSELMSERAASAQTAQFRAARYKCAGCLIVFHCADTLEEHRAAKHGPSACCCPVCGRALPSVDHFTRHYRRHMRRYECGSCGLRSQERRAIQAHWDTEHSDNRKQYTCDKCGQVSLTADAHRYHRDCHKARVSCSLCDKTFSHRAGLMTHHVAVHKMNNSFPCAECGKVFRWRTSLNKHMARHRDKGPTTAAHCVECDVSFRSVCSYKRHLRNSLKHVTHEQLKFVCDECGRRFANKTKLRDHIEEKHLHRAFSCQLCGKRSKNRVCLEQHVRNVHRGRPATRMCHHCGKGFPTKVQLESHIRSHTGERPYICELCPTTFSQQSNLYKHTRQVHLNIKSKRYSARKDVAAGAPSAAGAPAARVAGAPGDIKMLHYSPDKGFVMG